MGLKLYLKTNKKMGRFEIHYRYPTSSGSPRPILLSAGGLDKNLQLKLELFCMKFNAGVPHRSEEILDLVYFNNGKDQHSKTRNTLYDYLYATTSSQQEVRLLGDMSQQRV